MSDYQKEENVMSPIEYIDGCEINAAMNTIDNRGLNDRPLAMAYVPYQEFEDLLRR